MNILGDNIENFDIKTEQKENGKEVLERKRGISEYKVFEEMNKLRFNKISFERKSDWTLEKLYLSPKNHYKNKKQ